MGTESEEIATISLEQLDFALDAATRVYRLHTEKCRDPRVRDLPIDAVPLHIWRDISRSRQRIRDIAAEAGRRVAKGRKERSTKAGMLLYLEELQLPPGALLAA